MSHRAYQILRALKALHEGADPWRERVFIRRAFALSEIEGDLPAMIIAPGEDTPSSPLGNSNMAFIDSSLSVQLVLAATGETEEEIVEQLVGEHRAASHRLIMADEYLGLEFVTGTAYQGSSPIEITVSGARPVGFLETRWQVAYRMNFKNPE